MESPQDLFVETSLQLRANLELIRSKTGHSVAIGDAAEVALRSWLASHLTSAWGVGHGEVHDAAGQKSKQTDAVIVSETAHPRTWSKAHSHFLADGVGGMAECKAVLTSGELVSAKNVAGSWRALQFGVPRGATKVEVFDSTWLETWRPALLFAYQSQMTLQTVKERVFDKEESPTFDAVCLLDRGLVIRTPPDVETEITEVLQAAPGSLVVVDQEDRILITLLAWLTAALPPWQTTSPVGMWSKLLGSGLKR